MTTANITAAYEKYTHQVSYNHRPMFLIDNYHDLQLFVNEIGAHEFRVYLFDTETGESGDEGVGQIFGAAEFIKWIQANDHLRFTYADDFVAFTVDMFDTNGDMLTDLDIVC